MTGPPTRWRVNKQCRGRLAQGAHQDEDVLQRAGALAQDKGLDFLADLVHKVKRRGDAFIEDLVLIQVV